MSVPTTYTWPLSTTAVGPPPDPGPFVSQPLLFGSADDARKKQFARGIKFGNVPAGRADFIVHGGPRVHHVNSVVNVLHEPIEKLGFSGVIVFSRKDTKKLRVPSSVRGTDHDSVDRFSNPIFPFTGVYPPGTQLLNIADGAWVVTGTMNDPRSDYVGGELLDGRVIVAGGLNATLTPLASAETFSTGTDTWSSRPAMPNAKAKPAGTVLSNGDFLVVGGSGTTPNEATASYRYLTASDSWLVVPTPLIARRKDFDVVTLLDGRVLAPGGTGLSASAPFTGSEVFEHTDNTWHSAPDVGPPIPLYPYDREGYTLTLLDDGSALLVGGKDPRDNRPTNHAFRYFPNERFMPATTASWSVEQSMSFARYKHSAVKLFDGRVLVMGGEGGTRSNLSSQFPFLLGAQYGSDEAIPDAEIYDPSTGAWSSAKQMNIPRSRAAAHLVAKAGAESRVVVAGGQSGGTILSSSEVHDVEFIAWKEVTELVVAVKDHRMFQISLPVDSSPYSFLVPSGRTGDATVHSSSQEYQTNG